jgi:uncharacterized membrane-anchored protein YitT (DUF2179 family)
MAQFSSLTTHRNTILVTIVTLFASLAPLWMAFLWFQACSKTNYYPAFFIDGQFYLYSASLYTSGAYTLYYYKKKNADFNSYLFWISVIFLIISAVLYAFLIAIREVQQTLSNQQFWIWTSVLCFALSVVVFYIAQYIQGREMVDIAMERSEEVNDIKKGLP